MFLLFDCRQFVLKTSIYIEMWVLKEKKIVWQGTTISSNKDHAVSLNVRLKKKTSQHKVDYDHQMVIYLWGQKKD